MSNLGRGKRLADLSVQPDEDVYEPPPPSECRTEIFPIDLDTAYARLVIRQDVYAARGKIAHFSIQQEERVGNEWLVVARVDTSGGTVHRHQYTMNSTVDIYDHRELAKIPVVDGWETVDKMFSVAYDLMIAEWEANRRRWRGV